MNMKKSFLVIGFLIMVVLFTGCAANRPTVPEAGKLSAEEKAFIRLWGYDNLYTVRWYNGPVAVYDATGYNKMQQIIDEWNSIIGGPVTFHLSSDSKSPVKIYSSPIIDKNWEATSKKHFSTYALTEVNLTIDPFFKNDYSVRLHSFRAVVGFNYRKGPSDVCSHDDNISNILRRMTKALYRVPPKYPLF